MKSHLQGKIEINKNHKSFKETELDLKSKPKNISMSDTFMSNFNNLGLTHEEKQNLTQENRCEIIHYQSLSLEDVKPFVKKLVQAIKKDRSDDLTIKVTGFGAYVFLSAIASQALPTHKKYLVEMDGIPISLYPQSYFKSKKCYHNIFVTYTIGDKSWLKSFRSLTAPPAFFERFNRAA